MIRYEIATVESLRDSWAGVERAFAVTHEAHERIAVLAYTAMVGELTCGDRLLVNSNAYRRQLGTGGDAFVVANLTALESGRVLPSDPPGGGHMVKARYTPQQMIVDALDDPAAPTHAAIDSVEDLSGMAVVVADLHSAVGPIAAGYRLIKPSAKIVYVYTDWAALPAAFSRDNAVLREHGIIDATISTGQAFGGDFECVSVPSALAAARSVFGADLVIVAQGPGNLGTGTTWGFSSISTAGAVHDATLMGARTHLAIRYSGADSRGRHTGISHHTLTVLERMLAVSTHVHQLASAPDLAATLHALNERRENANLPAHTIHTHREEGLRDALTSLPITLKTMGRTFEDDPAPFIYSALAGLGAAHSR